MCTSFVHQASKYKKTEHKNKNLEARMARRGNIKEELTNRRLPLGAWSSRHLHCSVSLLNSSYRIRVLRTWRVSSVFDFIELL